MISKTVNGMRQCSTCGETKDVDSFSWITNRGCRLRNCRCKACCTIATKKAIQKRRRVDPEGARRAQWATNLKKKGMTCGDYERMLADQSGLCGICGTAEPGGRGRFHVDHDHSAGTIRGLLCNGCNIGLGHFHDNIESLAKAIQYLDRRGAAVKPQQGLLFRSA